MTEDYLWNKRAYLLEHHPVQHELMNTPARFVTVPAGRRSGKTECAKRYLAGKAMEGTEFNPSRFFFGAPTRQQAKDIFWADMLAYLPKPMIIDANISELRIRITNFRRQESHIYVHGLDKPERIEGSPWDGCVIDEIANCHARAWPLHIRPSLSTPGRFGWAWLIGVPEGRNHYYDMHQAALRDTTGEWAGYWWPSEDILPASEIEAAKRDLDEQSYEQEYRGSFVTFAGQCYYNYRAERHEAELEYDENRPLIIAFDFNVEPGVACIGQEMALPSRGMVGTGWLGEVYIPRNSNTPAVCRKVVQDWGGHKGDVRCYGDATGGARRTSGEFGNDWQLVERELRSTFGTRLTFHVKSYNPSERSRVNAVNSRLFTADETVHMMVDPAKCPHLVRDFEGVLLLEGGSGEIDKKSNRELTHISDAAGYYVAEEFPVSRRVTGHIPSADIEAAIHA